MFIVENMFLSTYLLHIPPLIAGDAIVELQRVVFDLTAVVAITEARFPQSDRIIRLGRRFRTVED